MLSVRISEVPPYLRAGGFYQGLDLEKSEESVSVPDNVLKNDDSVCSNDDLIHLLHSLQFWAVPILPQSVIAFVIYNSSFSATSEVDPLTMVYPELQDLIAIRAIEDEDKRSMYAIQHGLPDVLRYFHEKGVSFIFAAANFAAQADQLEVLKYLVSINCFVDNLTGAHAAKIGSTKCLEFLLTQMEFNDRALNTAASAGQVECLKLLYAHGQRGELHTINFAAEAGQLDSLKFLHEQKCEWDETTCAVAAERGHLECLKFLHENGCPWAASTASDAVYGGHLECLVYAHTHGAPLGDDLIVVAAYSGQVECLKYLHEQGVPWDAGVCRAAAQCGKLNTLTYAHESGCPWNGDTTHYAAGFAKYDCLKYAVEHGCEWDEARYEAMLADAPSHVHADNMRKDLQQICLQS